MVNCDDDRKREDQSDNLSQSLSVDLDLELIPCVRVYALQDHAIAMDADGLDPVVRVRVHVGHGSSPSPFFFYLIIHYKYTVVANECQRFGTEFLGISQKFLRKPMQDMSKAVWNERFK